MSRESAGGHGEEIWIVLLTESSPIVLKEKANCTVDYCTNKEL